MKQVFAKSNASGYTSWDLTLFISLILFILSFFFQKASFATCNGIESPVSLEIETKRGIGVPSTFPMSWAYLPEAWWNGDCEVFKISGLGMTASSEDGANSVSFNLDGLFLTAIGITVDIVGGAFIPLNPVPIATVDCYHFDVAHMRGGPSVYSVQLGDSGGPYIQTAKGVIRYCDELIVESTEDTIIELPYSLGADLLAAESFGDPEQTYGLARARVSGFVGGIPVLSDQGEVVSVSVIPTTQNFSSTGAVTLPVNAGTNVIQVQLEAEVYTEAHARCTGFFCLITASATASCNMPNSFVIGQFQGDGGSPMPTCITRISSEHTGIVYFGAPLPAPSVEITYNQGQLLLNWDNVAEATHYRILELHPDGSTALIGMTSESSFDATSFMQESPLPNQVMLLQVTAVRN